MDSASVSVQPVPFVGDFLAPPLSSFAQAMTSLVGTLQQFIRFVDISSIVFATIVFVVPFIYYVWKWFPWRFAFIREATAGKKLLPAQASAELFALRAIAHAPMRDLAKITTDPMGAWLDGDTATIRKLAALELARDGLKMPAASKVSTLSGHDLQGTGPQPDPIGTGGGEDAA